MRSSFALLVICLFLVTAPSTATLVDNGNAPQSQSEQKKNTLVIKSNGEPVRYKITASKGATPENESSDSVRGTEVTGRVGHTANGNTDTKDVIQYDGYIQNFDYGGKDIRVEMNGEEVPPKVLAANHISISDPRSGNSSKPISYRIEINGRAVPGEQTEDDDIGSGRTIRGAVHNDTDTFYYIGNATNPEFTGTPKVEINGRNIPIVDKTPTQTSPPQTTTKSAAPSQPSNSSSPTSSSSPHSGFLVGIIGSVGILAAIIVVGVIYFRTKDRRW